MRDTWVTGRKIRPYRGFFPGRAAQSAGHRLRHRPGAERGFTGVFPGGSDGDRPVPGYAGQLQQTYGDKHFKAIVADYFEYPFERSCYTVQPSPLRRCTIFPYEKKKRIYQKLYRALKPGGYYVECDYGLLR